MACTLLFGVAMGAAAEALYQNTEHGFVIAPPAGWVQTAGNFPAHQPVVFTKKTSSRLVMVGVTIDDLSGHPEIQTAEAFSRDVLGGLQKRAPVKIVEPPHRTDVNGMVGSTFTFDMGGTRQATAEQVTMRTTMCQFLHGRKIFSVVVTGNSDMVAEERATIDAVIASFRLLPAATPAAGPAGN